MHILLYNSFIFQLFGHERVSLLNGGFPEWKRLQLAQSGPYPTELGPGSFPEVIGDFQARWTAEYVSAFDDVMANFENKECDIVDAQSPEVCFGKGNVKACRFFFKL